MGGDQWVPFRGYKLNSVSATALLLIDITI